jgi:hypothetical protein
LTGWAIIDYRWENNQEEYPMKKLIMLATAVAAVAAFALPASASAAEWHMEGNPVVGNPKIGASGTFGFAGGYDCTMHMEIELTGGTDVGHITKFEVTTSTCVIKETLKAIGCTALSADTFTSGTVTDTGTDIEINNFALHLTFTGGSLCAGGISLTLSSIAGSPVTAEVDNVNAITKITKVSGNLHNSFTGGNSAISGSNTPVTPAGTYGL